MKGVHRQRLSNCTCRRMTKAMLVMNSGVGGHDALETVGMHCFDRGARRALLRPCLECGVWNLSSFQLPLFPRGCSVCGVLEERSRRVPWEGGSAVVWDVQARALAKRHWRTEYGRACSRPSSCRRSSCRPSSCRMMDEVEEGREVGCSLV